MDHLSQDNKAYLENLINLAVDDQLTPDDKLELNQALKEIPGAIEFYSSWMDNHHATQVWIGYFKSHQEKTKPPSQRINQVKNSKRLKQTISVAQKQQQKQDYVWYLTAALLMLGMGLTVFIYNQNKWVEKENSSSVPVAETKDSQDVQIENAGQILRNEYGLIVLRDNKKLNISGTATLMIGDELITDHQQTVEMKLFDGRLRLFLDKNSRLLIDKRHVMKLEKGLLHTDIESNLQDPVYFETVENEYRVLGTSFFLEVNDGKSSLRMLEGTVEVSDKITKKVSVVSADEQPPSRVKITLTDFDSNILPKYKNMSADEVIDVSIPDLPNNVMNIVLNFHGLNPDHIKYTITSPTGLVVTSKNNKPPWSVYGQLFKKRALDEISFFSNMLKEGVYKIECQYFYGDENNSKLNGTEVLRLNISQ